MSREVDFSAIVIDFITSLDRSATDTDCFDALAKSVESLGFDGISYAAMPRDLLALTSHSPVFMVSKGFSREFLIHYQAADFASHDFTIERIERGDLAPMNWADELARGQLSRMQKEVIQVAKVEYGINNAVSVPVLSNQHFLAGASVTSGESSTGFSTLWEERNSTLKLIVRLFHNKIFSSVEFRKHYYLPVLQSLSSKEKKMLKLVANGHRLKQSEDLYGISPTRAGNILSDLYKKLGVSNASELSYLLGVHQIMDML